MRIRVAILLPSVLTICTQSLVFADEPESSVPEIERPVVAVVLGGAGVMRLHTLGHCRNWNVKMC